MNHEWCVTVAAIGGIFSGVLIGFFIGKFVQRREDAKWLKGYLRIGEQEPIERIFPGFKVNFDARMASMDIPDRKKMRGRL